ncbi:MAG TPA: hypothetical protein VEX17_01640 [Bacillales bacterium]|nr:hypothetical protein [Bacillales bacterium]
MPKATVFQSSANRNRLNKTLLSLHSSKALLILSLPYSKPTECKITAFALVGDLLS